MNSTATKMIEMLFCKRKTITETKNFPRKEVPFLIE